MSAPAPSDTARVMFGDRLALAQAYADRLADAGVREGHIGPREVPRLWDRHLVNCALLTDLLPDGVRVVDVGSGAGLPGVVLAIRRPDLQVDLVEPMLRRTRFLESTTNELGLADRVRVVRGRAEDAAVRAAVGGARWVVARAVAPLDRLVGWSVPLLAPGGHLLALKGESAAAEVREHQAAMAAAGCAEVAVHELGSSPDQTWVVDVRATGTKGRRR